jgi:hypothetical protein
MAWLLPLGFTLLEAEQWNIVASCQSQFPAVAAASAAHMRLTTFAAVLIGWLWTRTAMRARSARRAAFGIHDFLASASPSPFLATPGDGWPDDTRSAA